MTGNPTPEALAAAIARGASDAEAGRRFGLSRSAVRRLRRRWGIAACRDSCRRPDPGRVPFRWGQGNLGERAIARLYAGRRYDETEGRAPACRDGAARPKVASPSSAAPRGDRRRRDGR